MNARSIIRPVFAGFLLMLLAVSVTPQHWLHEWVSGHEHSWCGVDNPGTPQIAKADSLCHCDPVHFVHHFFESGEFRLLPTPPVYHPETFISAILSCCIQQPRYFFSLHAPPSLS